MKIRFATPYDKQQVLALLTQLGILINKKLRLHEPKNENASIYGSENFDNIIHSDIIKIFVLEKINKIIGAASFFIFTNMIAGDKFAHIDDFIIEESERKKGYGKVLMDRILKYAKKYQINPVKLTSSLEFREAHKFYEKIGGKFTQKVIKFDTSGT
jgi:GNAT superfamily N-acetyltransferase